MPLMWSSLTCSSFNWVYYHVPTYIHHSLPVNYPCFAVDEKEKKTSVVTGEVLDIILESLTKSHNELLHLLCKEIKKPGTRATTKKSGSIKADDVLRSITLSDALSTLTSKLVVKTLDELRCLLKQFIDHRIIILREDNEAGELIQLNLNMQDIERLAKD